MLHQKPEMNFQDKRSSHVRYAHHIAYFHRVRSAVLHIPRHSTVLHPLGDQIRNRIRAIEEESEKR